KHEIVTEVIIPPISKASSTPTKGSKSKTPRAKLTSSTSASVTPSTSNLSTSVASASNNVPLAQQEMSLMTSQDMNTVKILPSVDLTSHSTLDPKESIANITHTGVNNHGHTATSIITSTTIAGTGSINLSKYNKVDTASMYKIRSGKVYI